MILLVDDTKFQELVEKCALSELAESKPIKNTVFFKGEEYVVTGKMGSGSGSGWQEVYANRVVDLQNYKGELKPLGYSEQHTEYNNKRRERGYVGLLVAYKHRKVVFCEKVVFQKSKVNAVQTSLF